MDRDIYTHVLTDRHADGRTERKHILTFFLFCFFQKHNSKLKLLKLIENECSFVALAIMSDLLKCVMKLSAFLLIFYDPFLLHQ